MVFLKEFFEKVDFEKNQQTTKKHANKFNLTCQSNHVRPALYRTSRYMWLCSKEKHEELTSIQKVKTHLSVNVFQDMKPGGSDEYLSASPNSTGLAPDDADMGGVNTPESPILEINLYTTQSPNEDSSYSDKTNVQDQNVHDTVKSPDTERVGETFVKDDNDEMASSRETIATSHADEYSDNYRLGVSDKGDDDLDGVQKSDVDTDMKIESKNSEEEIRRRMVSDKLIPEVKLTFNVNTDTEVSQSQTSRETGKVGDVK